jgi:hypothetical protein
MHANPSAAHVLSKLYPELTTDEVSRYVVHLKETLGPSRSSAVYSLACRAAPIGDNPMGLRRGSVVEVEGEKYLVLGSGFMALELASLARPGRPRTIDRDEFVRLGENGFRVCGADESASVLGALPGLQA